MDSNVALSAALRRAWLSASLGLVAAAAALYAPSFGSGNFRVSGLFGQTLGLLAAVAIAFALGAHVGSVLPWISRKAREEEGPSPPLVTAGTVIGAVGGFFVSAFLYALVFSRMGSAGAMAGRTVLLLAVLAGSVLGASLLGRFPARPPASRAARATIVWLPVALFTPGLWMLLKPPVFPASASLPVRDLWAQKHLAPHYLRAAGFVRSSPLLQQRLGTDLSLAPAADGKNGILYGGDESTATFTVEVVSPQGRGRCEIRMKIPYAPKGAPPVFGPASCEIAGERLELANDGRERSGGYTAPGSSGQGER